VALTGVPQRKQNFDWGGISAAQRKHFIGVVSVLIYHTSSLGKRIAILLPQSYPDPACIPQN